MLLKREPLEWAVKMNWHHLLFAHWPISCDQLRPHVPSSLRLDKYDGRAWVGLVPFRMTGIRMRRLPPMPTVSRFCELNVRTYVNDGRRHGVWFLSLDATSRLAVALARRWYRLNYRRAAIRWRHDGRSVHFASHGLHGAGDFEATYRPVGARHEAKAGSFEHFLTERYLLWAQGNSGELYKARVDHPLWQLQKAEATIEANTMAESVGLELPPVHPHLLYAEGVEAVIERPRRVG